MPAEFLLMISVITMACFPLTSAARFTQSFCVGFEEEKPSLENSKWQHQFQPVGHYI